MNSRTLLKSAAVFLIVYLALLALSLQYGPRYVELWLPLYRWEVSWFTPDYRILSLGIQDNHGDAVVALNLLQTRLTVIEEHLLYPGGTFSSSTLAGHTLQHVLLMLSLLAAWPVRHFSERLLMWISAVPFLLLMEMLDTPLMLQGAIDDLILANVAPDASSFLIYWMHFLDGGGRLALSIAAALAAVGFGRMFAARMGR